MTGTVRSGFIEPIGAERQRETVAATAAAIGRAGRILRRRLEPIPVRFDLIGRAAGIYRVDGRQRVIRYNPYIFARDFARNLATTVPHEVAHYATDVVYGLRNIRPHGTEWQALMHALGADAARTFSADLEGVPMRRQRRHAYQCGCSTHALSTRRHNRVRRREARYFCRRCGEELRQGPGAPESEGGSLQDTP